MWTQSVRGEEGAVQRAGRQRAGVVAHVVGAGTGPALLLRGIGGSADSFAPQFGELNSSLRMLAWDAPGYGRSGDPGRRFDLDDYADAAAEMRPGGPPISGAPQRVVGGLDLDLAGRHGLRLGGPAHARRMLVSLRDGRIHADVRHDRTPRLGWVPATPSGSASLRTFCSWCASLPLTMFRKLIPRGFLLLSAHEWKSLTVHTVYFFVRAMRG